MIHLLKKTAGILLVLLGIYLALVTFFGRYTLLEELTDYDHLPELRTLFAQGKYENVLRMGRDLKEANWCCDMQELDSLISASDEEVNTVGRCGVNFLRGFFSGSSSSTAGAAGAMVSDLFIYGDLRDIFVQTGLFAIGREGDKVLLGISGAGLLLEALPVANWFPAALKFLHKSGSLTSEFTERLVKIIKKLTDCGKLSSAERGIFLELYNLFLRCGLYRSSEIMKFVKTPEQLAAAGKFAKKYPESFYLSAKASNGKILDSGLRFSDAELLKAARKGAMGIASLKRCKLLAAVKIISSGRTGAFIRAAVREKSSAAFVFYALSLLSTASGMVLILLGRRKKLKNS